VSLSERSGSADRAADRAACPNYWGRAESSPHRSVVIGPERVPRSLARRTVKVVRVDPLPSYQVKQHWHERYVGDLPHVATQRDITAGLALTRGRRSVVI